MRATKWDFFSTRKGKKEYYLIKSTKKIWELPLNRKGKSWKKPATKMSVSLPPEFATHPCGFEWFYETIWYLKQLLGYFRNQDVNEAKFM